MKSLFTIIFISLFSVTVFGQGAFLEKGQSGFGIGAGFVTNKDVTGFGGIIGYSVSGILDFGVSLNRFNFDQKLLGSDLSATVISPIVTFYALKQNEDIPFSFSIDASYDWQNYSNDVLDNNNIDMTGGFFSAGSSLFSNFRASSSMRIQPSISFSYVTGEVILEDNNGNEKTEKDNTTVFDFSLALAFDTSPNNIIVVKPRVSINEGTTSCGIVFVYIFSTD